MSNNNINLKIIDLLEHAWLYKSLICIAYNFGLLSLIHSNTYIPTFIGSLLQTMNSLCPKFLTRVKFTISVFFFYTTCYLSYSPSNHHNFYSCIIVILYSCFATSIQCCTLLYFLQYTSFHYTIPQYIMAHNLLFIVVSCVWHYYDYYYDYWDDYHHHLYILYLLWLHSTLFCYLYTATTSYSTSAMWQLFYQRDSILPHTYKTYIFHYKSAKKWTTGRSD